ncbi:AMP-binding, conserved site-containing protein [Artemisia annua]|uniref:AMP-binding, conserved site-containing protein n=1 Tax=Artemisia annua TaxID=35608 RepID=A0A2U1KDG8_ARTAN|nr:AMP-binding, conserved site-containing protein [Artemisia annua]
MKKLNTRLNQDPTKLANRSFKVQCKSSSQGPPPLTESRQPMEGVVRSAANYIPLSPISFLERAAKVYRDRTSVVYGSIKYTWEETHRRCVKLASSLNQFGVSRGDVVAILAPNVPAMLELQFAIPMAGAVVCPLNTRLDSNMIATLLKHSETKMLFVDYQLFHKAKEAVNLLKKTHSESRPPLLVVMPEVDSQSPLTLVNEYKYEGLVEAGATDFPIIRPYDECDPISLNYTSGTTSKPKGVLYSHRGAYLNSLGCVFMHGMSEMPTYLWSVPLFHSNGWGLSWGIAIVGGTNVCLRRSDPKDIFDNIVRHNVTHMGGVPTVLNMIANSLVANQKPLPHRVEIMTAGSPPPPSVLSKIEELGFHVSHAYGLTETGLSTWCLWKPEWDLLPIEEQGKLKA